MTNEHDQAHGERTATGPRGPSVRLVASVAAVALVLGGLGGWVLRGRSDRAGAAERSAQTIATKVLRAWATGDAADIDAAYAPGATLVLEGEVVTGSMATIIRGAIDYGNTYAQVGPASYYTPASPDADTYVSTMIRVTGHGHPNGDPLVTYFRIQDGKVVRHVSAQANCLVEDEYCTPVEVWAA